jgi:hypothetical protein
MSGDEEANDLGKKTGGSYRVSEVEDSAKMNRT